MLLFMQEQCIHIVRTTTLFQALAKHVNPTTVSRKSLTSVYIFAFITILFTLNGVRSICNWITVIRIMKISNEHHNHVDAPYLFVVYGFWLEDEIGDICGYLITVIADSLMASEFFG